ncbi:MAG: hypothetical protein ACI8UO_006024 [Verrucomicrobiales bacterium]|jgi:hypothetical protein
MKNILCENLRLSALCVFISGLAFAQEAPTESDYYEITTFESPEGSVVEVGAIDFMGGEKVIFTTRRGEIWTVDNAFSYPEKEAKWKLYARYQHEPLGIAVKDDWVYITQRPDVTKMKDEDGDGRADIFEIVAQPWGITGDYHEYAFGTRFDKDDNIWNVLCLTGSFTSNTKYRGWIIRVNADGTVTPTVCGVRSPGGIGFGPGGEVFYTDNQGAWNGSSSLKHAKIGSFQGNPNGNAWFQKTDAIAEPPYPPTTEGSRTVIERENIPTYVPPAIMLPHGKVGQSPTGMILDESGGKFGPFEGQLFVAEQTYSNIQRCFLEEVNGVYQGVVFPFLSGFKSGNIGINMKDGVVFTGGSNRGWGARGGQAFNFERVNWTGKIPFEVHEMRAKPDGFELTFTQPVDKVTASAAESYSMRAFTYIYQKGYGSPEVDEVKPSITVASVSEDGKTVRLKVDSLTKGHVHELHLDGVKNEAGQQLLHPVGYYTLNEIPAK